MKQQYQRNAIEILWQYIKNNLDLKYGRPTFLNGATDIFWSKIVSQASLAILWNKVWKQPRTHHRHWLLLKLKYEESL